MWWDLKVRAQWAELLPGMSKYIMPNRLVRVKREDGRLVINGVQNGKENEGIQELLRYQEMS